MSDLPQISVIIVTHNSEATIEGCINSLTSQSYPMKKFEIIIVDDGSKDKTVVFAKKAGADLVINTEPCTIGTARNKGVEKARGTVLAFLDSDCEANDDWLSTIMKELKPLTAITGPIENAFKQNLISWSEYFMEFCGFDEYRPKSLTRFLPGCNQAISKESFNLTNGFVESKLSSDDVYFGKILDSVGVVKKFIPEMKIRHLCSTDINKFQRKMSLRGLGFIQTRKDIRTLPFSFLARSRFFIPLLFLGMIISKGRYAVRAKKLQIFLNSFPIFLRGNFSFCKGAWKEIKSH